ncbi:MAG: hypothetical protein L6V87_10410 [Ruminococcus sp.]|nr:MAG: hypothetical protein L6V87_10410 [Ruminococcus sp.]
MTADRADFGGRSEDPCDSLSSCSDEELVERCRGGRLSVPAASELIYRYFGFIKSKAASMCGSASVCDDFVQEGVLGFLSAIRHYSSDKGHSVFIICLFLRGQPYEDRRRKAFQAAKHRGGQR